MSSLSVDVNGFKVNDQWIDAGSILPSHKKRLESVISSYFLNRKNICHLSSSNDEVPFNLKLDPGRPSLELDGRCVLLKPGSSLRKVERVVHYYQHIGALPSAQLDPQEAHEIRSAAGAAIRAAKEASIPGVSDEVIAGVRIADDSLTTLQNILFAVPTIGLDDPIANHLGYYAGTFWALFSLRELRGGVLDYKRAKEIGDEEGARRAEARLASGGIVSAASLTYLAGKVCETLGLDHAASLTLGSANLLFGAGSALAMCTTAISAARCYRFGKRIDKYLNNPKLNELERLQGALRFLEGSLTIIPKERAELKEQIEKEHRFLGTEEKSALFKKKLIDLAEKKVKYMKRRTSSKSIRMIFEHAGPILEKLSNENTRAEGIKEAHKLIATVKSDNKKKMFLFIVGFLAAAICLAGAIMGTVFSAGLAATILYSIAGALSLCLAIYSVGNVLVAKDLGKLDSIPTSLDLNDSQKITAVAS